MKCMVRIGYKNILLPDHKGVEKLIDMLSKGVECESWYGHGPITVIGEFEIGMMLVPDSTKFEATTDLDQRVEDFFKSKGRKEAKSKALSARSLHLIDHKK